MVYNDNYANNIFEVIHSTHIDSTYSLIANYDEIDDIGIVLDHSNDFYLSAPSGFSDNIATKVFEDMQLDIGDSTEALLDKKDSSEELIVTFAESSHACVSTPSGMHYDYKICSIDTDCDRKNIAMDHGKKCPNGRLVIVNSHTRGFEMLDVVKDSAKYLTLTPNNLGGSP